MASEPQMIDLTSNTQATKKDHVFKLRIYGKGVSMS